MVQTPVSRHLFPDIEFLKGYIDTLDWQKLARESKDTEDCRFLLNALKSHQPSDGACVDVGKDIIYRAVDAGISPLSLTGAFGCGGRLNIGTAQTREDFPTLKPAGGLYGSLELETAIAENGTHGLPGAPALFALRPHKDLKFYSLDAILNTLEPLILLPPQRSLTAAVLQIPMHADWKYRKYPAISQVLGAWLRASADEAHVDGITWHSVRKPEGRNVFLFVHSDEDALALLDCAVAHS